MSKEEYLDKIEQLRTIAEVNILCAEIISIYFETKRNDPYNYMDLIESSLGSYLSLVCTNHVFESVSILNSILYPSKNEVSPLLNLKIEDVKKHELNQIREEFKNNGLQELRHNFIDHKNNSKIGHPIMFIITPIPKTTIQTIKNILVNFTDWFYKSYNDLVFYSNPSLVNSGIQKIIEILENIDSSSPPSEN